MEVKSWKKFNENKNMKEVNAGLQRTIDMCEDIYDVEDQLTGWGLDWYQEYTFNFKNKRYSFQLIDSGKSDEPQYGNYPKVSDLKEI